MNCLNDDFSNINLKVETVEMKRIDDKQYALYINMRNDKNIIINGCCSAGNITRASQVTCKILNLTLIHN